MKEIFNLQYWLHVYDPKGETQPQAPKTTNLSAAHHPDRGFCNTNDTETVLSRVEASCTDLTGSYQDWIKLGFAFAREHGEAGRGYFHRVSRFHPKYSYSECDKKYDHCLKADKGATNISTFFYLAQQAGVDTVCEGGGKAEAQAKAEEEKKDKAEAEEKAKEKENSDSEAKEEAKVCEVNIDTVEEACTATIHRGLPIDPNPHALFITPQLPNAVYENLPGILKESCALFKPGIEQDVFLIASLTVLSGCLPNIHGIYFEEEYSAHLYAFITAPAGSGKGKMKWAKYFGQAIHDRLVEQSRSERDIYLQELQHYENLHKSLKATAEKPVEPRRRMFYIPGNSSSSAFIQALADNYYKGVIFETEADTLAATFKQDWGNFSDVLRKAYHHEDTSMFRRKDNEHIEIKDPHLAIALSGTPNQVLNMMPDPENGLFSRFMYYAFEDDSEFKSPFSSSGRGNYAEYFRAKSLLVAELFGQLDQLAQPITFKLTEEQGERFTSIFKTMLRKNKLLLGSDFTANVKRLGLITFRIAMVISALRLLEDAVTGTGNFTEQATGYPSQEGNKNGGRNLVGSRQLSNKLLVCSDRDFETAISIVTTLEKHAVAVFKYMPNNGLRGKILAFYENLPNQFDRQTYLRVAKEMGIEVKAAEKYIALFKPKLLNHEHNLYTKITK